MLLTFEKIEDILGSSGTNNTYKVENKGEIKGNLIAKGENDILEYSGPFSSTVRVNLTNSLVDSEATGFKGILGIDQILGVNQRFGKDIISTTQQLTKIEGRDGEDTLTGSSQNDHLSGGDEKDILIGGNGIDTLDGGDDADILIGGSGNDILIGGTGKDTYRFADDWGTDTITEISDTNTFDFSDFTQGLTVDVGSSNGEGIKVIGGSLTNVANKVIADQNKGVKGITTFKQGIRSTSYQFKADFVNNPEIFEIDAEKTTSESTTIDFSAIPANQDLYFRIADSRNRIEIGTLNSSVSNIASPKDVINIFQRSLYKKIAVVQLHNHLNNVFIIGGLGNNFYRFTDSQKFKGSIQGGADGQNLAIKKNILDHSQHNFNATDGTVNLETFVHSGIIGNNARINNKPFSRITGVFGLDKANANNKGIVKITGSTQDNEWLIGGQLGDFIESGGGDGNLILAYEKNDVINGGNGDDIIDAGDGLNAVAANSGNDVVVGGKNADFLSGGDGNDTLSGEDGNDILIGGNNNDILTGGKGDDTYRFDDGWVQDTIIETKESNGGNDTLDFSLVNSALTYVIDSQKIKAGYTNQFTPDAVSSLGPGISFQKATGTFASNANKTNEVEGIEELKVGSGATTIRFGDNWKNRLKIDNGILGGPAPNGRASSLVLDFRGISQPLTFVFGSDGSLVVKSSYLFMGQSLLDFLHNCA